MHPLSLPIREYSTEEEDLLAYGVDASGLRGRAAAVAWPRNVAEVVALLRHCHEHRLPVVPRGAGTATTAAAVPVEGGVLLSLEHMGRILEIDPSNLLAVVEPGVINGRLQRELREMGLFYPPDPASLEFSTLGGNVATNAAGPRALKYGTTRDHVLALEAVLPSGGLISVGRRTPKGVVGYDLARLLVGSEGTLAVFTRLVLKVLPRPEGLITLLALFKDLGAVGRAVEATLRAGIIPRCMELMDRACLEAVEEHTPLGLASWAQALLLVELDGPEAALSEEAQRLAELLGKAGAELQVAQEEQARERLWQARRALSPALYERCPHKKAHDVVVPRSRMTEMLVFLRQLSELRGLPIATFGHAGDGNLHVNLLPQEEHIRGLQQIERELFQKVLSLGGTISGEHGVGLTKRPYMDMELGPAELSLMKGIKGVFDPQGLLNPGKALP